MKQLFLFVRPPRPFWPFNGPGSSVWPPLAFASLAASLREALPDLRVAIVDAPAIHMGWQSLGAELRRLKPTYVGIGEEAVSCLEGLRLARLAKALGAWVIAGGCFFSHIPEEAIGSGLIDIVVHGEGECTLVELVHSLRSDGTRTLRHVSGISFADGDRIVQSPPRPLIPDLDRLPIPAYDLLPVASYGHGSRNHPDLAAIELGRGCIGSCRFCVLWRQMGEHRGGVLVPHLRAKSPERLREEIRILTGRFQRRYLGWVDPCFNADPGVPGLLAELMLKENLPIGQSAWVRADAIVRDAASGALASCVRAGLNEVYMGIERADSASLSAVRKSIGPEVSRSALQILARDFPAVFTIGSFIYGMAGDTPETVRGLRRFASALSLDFPFFIPFTPLPGTPDWRPELWDPSGEKFRKFGFLPGTLGNGRHSALDKALFWSDFFQWDRARFRNNLRALFHTDARKRRLSRRLMLRSCVFGARTVFQTLVGSRNTGGMRFPRWYAR